MSLMCAASRSKPGLLVVAAGDVGRVGGDPLPDLGVELAPRELLDRRRRDRAELVVGDRLPAVADQVEVGRQQVVVAQVVDRGDELPRRQVARGAEDDDHGRRRAPVLAQSLKKRMPFWVGHGGDFLASAGLSKGNGKTRKHNPNRFSLRVRPGDGNPVCITEYGSPLHRERPKALPADKDHLQAAAEQGGRRVGDRAHGLEGGRGPAGPVDDPLPGRGQRHRLQADLLLPFPLGRRQEEGGEVQGDGERSSCS
jgi:hypothetical protein